MTAYIDTSVLMQELFNPPDYLKEHANLFKKITNAYASELLMIEANRTIDRYRIEGKLRDDELARSKQYLLEYEKRINIVEISADIKKRAKMPFSTVVASLDAIHLCTAIYLKEELDLSFKMFTLDRQLATACMAEGVELAL